MKIVIQFVLIFVLVTDSFCQEIPVHPSYENIYDFLDELANDRIIQLYSVIKPYSQITIYKKLNEAKERIDKLSARQKKELEFYLEVYKINVASNNTYSDNAKINLFKKSKSFSTGINPLGFFYRDSLVTVSLKPIWGIRYMQNDSGSIRHTWGGAEAYMTYGKHWGFYANLRENNMTEPLSLPSFLVQQEGGNYKIGAEGVEASTFSEMRGGITFAWKWGSLGLVKDQIEWGENYNGANIFSGRAPSFPMLKFNMSPVKWFKLNYFHGWLVSEVLDSTLSYYTSNGDFRGVYRNKYIAANMYSFLFWKGVDLSFGNSIVYSDMNVNPVYFIPFLFYKSVDHTINHNIDNQNSQMFSTINIRCIPHVHLYGNVFIDDFSYLRVFNSKRQNFVSNKAGISISNWPIKNVSLIFEYTKTSPIVYKHRVETLTFETNKFNLGNYLHDNSQEFYFSVKIKPFSRFSLSADYSLAQHGNEYVYDDAFKAELYPFMKDITWQNRQNGIYFHYEFISDSFLFLSFSNSDIKGFDVDGKTAQYYLDLYTPTTLQGKNKTINLGLNIKY